MKVPFSPPDISEKEIEYVADAMRSGWITTGPKVKKLEKLIAAYAGLPSGSETESPNCVCFSSQTASAEMCLRLLGIGEGDEVITSAYTYTATASVIAHVGAKIVLVDTQPGTFEMDYDALEEAITENTKAIIPVDFAGIPCDYDRIFDIVNSPRIRCRFKSCSGHLNLGRIAVIADSAHAFGAEYHGQKVGSVADFTNFSFHAVKNFTVAEGGAMTWREIPGVSSQEIYHQLQLFSLHGQNKDAFKRQKGGWEYDILGTWYKCNMTDITAAIGLAQFERYPDMLARRREIINRYDKAFRPLGIQVLDHYNSEHVSNGHLYVTHIPGITVEQRNEIIEKMAEAGVATNVHFKPLPLLTAYKKLGFDIKNYPDAYAYFANEITLPLYTRLTDEQVEYVIMQFTKILKEDIN